jgi:flagellar hook-basal body complex protein FliE
MVQISQTGATIVPQTVRQPDDSQRQSNVLKAQPQYKSFQETLVDFVNDVNKLQKNAEVSVQKLLTGEIKDVHDVMIAVEKAGTSFELMMEIRNKMIDAYHEILRIQM